jgi:putative hydrolase of the HAD superfamily
MAGEGALMQLKPMTDHPPIRAVLFDLDDTLNDRPRSWRKFVDVLSNDSGGWLGPCSIGEVHRAILAADAGGYRPKDELFPELCSCLPWRRPPVPEALEAFWRGQFPRCMVERDGAVEVLRTIRERGLRVGIVTNGRTITQGAKIEAMGLRPLVDTIVVSETAGVKKPDARIYEIALKNLAATASQTLFVGDHPRLDVWGPAQLGMRTAWLDCGRPWTDEFSPDWRIRGLAELLGVIG